jgi:hypothetical protein
MLPAFIFFSCLTQALALQGVDVSTAVTDFTCLKKSFPDFVLIKAFDFTGLINKNAIANINAAKAAGYSDIELLFSPNVPTGQAEGQVNNFLNSFAGKPYSIVWIMVEIGGWTADQGSNLAFLTDLTNAFRLKSTPIGISTSTNDWSSLIGSSNTCCSNLPLRYNSIGSSSTNFSDFKPFGGWTIPLVKKYSDNVSVCGFTIGQDLKNSSALELPLSSRLQYD